MRRISSQNGNCVCYKSLSSSYFFKHCLSPAFLSCRIISTAAISFLEDRLSTSYKVSLQNFLGSFASLGKCLNVSVSTSKFRNSFYNSTLEVRRFLILQFHKLKNNPLQFQRFLSVTKKVQPLSTHNRHLFSKISHGNFSCIPPWRAIEFPETYLENRDP